VLLHQQVGIQAVAPKLDPGPLLKTGMGVDQTGKGAHLHKSLHLVCESCWRSWAWRRARSPGTKVPLQPMHQQRRLSG
jgi:hypothetical protein